MVGTDSCQILLLQQVTNIITLLVKWQKGVIFLTLVVYFTWGYSIRVRFSLISEFIVAWHYSVSSLSMTKLSTPKLS